MVEPALDKDRFFASLYELVDTWTMTCELDEYRMSLRALFFRVTIEVDEPQVHTRRGSSRRPHATRRFRELGEIESLTARPFSEAEARSSFDSSARRRKKDSAIVIAQGMSPKWSFRTGQWSSFDEESDVAIPGKSTRRGRVEAALPPIHR